MRSKYLSGVLIIALSIFLCGFGEAQTDFKLPGPSGGEVAGVIVGAAAKAGKFTCYLAMWQELSRAIG
jgi:hypothetical protein